MSNNINKYSELVEKLEDLKEAKIRAESRLEAQTQEQATLEKQILEITKTETIENAEIKKEQILTKLNELFNEIEAELTKYDETNST